jgi:NitT/TauT family transport system ATP-binding protein
VASTPISAPGRAGSIVVSLRRVRREFDGGLVALDGLDLAVNDGEFIALVGPSGCGKSTLLRLVAGLDRPQAGAVEVAADDGASVAFVFQDAHLLPWRKALDNVVLPLELRGVARASRREAGRDALASVGLADAANLYPAQLSGGMRMRVSIARALVTRPRLLLLDEPFAALDEMTRSRLDEQLHALWVERRMTVLFVTHSVAEAVFLAQRVVVLSARPARLLAEVAVELAALRGPELRTATEFNAVVRRVAAAMREGVT